MTIIRDRAKVPEASGADLVETYNALSGRPPIKKFENRAIAEQRVSMAIMSAENEAGHAGVAKGEKPVALTTEELAAKVADNPHRTGSLSAELWDQANSKEPIVAKASKKAAPAAKTPGNAAGRKPSFGTVKATGAGTSKLQAESTRAKVLEFIAKQPKKTVTIEALDTEFSTNTRGFVMKLAQMGHVTLSA